MKNQIVIKIILLLLGVLSWGSLNASSGIDSHWNDPGVTVTQPDVWTNSGVLVTDPFGRIDPMGTSQDCTLVRECLPNGNCVYKKVCVPQ